ncbi:MAG: hypothetical protein IT445_10445 [Phycisphaeraceae bacterium]|nr:hypothetical protein [Phycisphaeraceae bacterium]
MNSKLPTAIAAGFITAAVGPFIWIGCWKLHAVWLAAVGNGVLIGLVMRLTNRSGEPVVPAMAAAFTAVACIVGYLVTDLCVIEWFDSVTGQPVQPNLIDALGRLVADLGAIILIALGCYLAFIIVRARKLNPGS